MTAHNHESHRTPPLELFCSYAPDDQPLFRQLEQRLLPLQRAGRLVLRHQGQITPGADVETTLSAWASQADVILLLVSPAYLASDTCHEEAMQAMQCSAHVIPVILSPCHWSDTVFGGLQCLPRNGQTITDLTNQDKAWYEVEEEIRRVIDEVSLSDVGARAQTAGQPRIWNVPFARNPFFTGRDELLERLHTQLHTTQTSAVSQPQAISGLGGIGKTQVAVEYAYRYGKEYQAVLWARADTTEELNASYTEIAGLLNLPQREAKEQEVIVLAVKGYLGSQGSWLLILDNADEPEVLTSFLPRSVKGQILVTTRASDLTDLGLGFQHALEVQTFTDEQGALFLLHRSNQLPPDATLDQAETEVQQHARAITHELGGLPLALDQVGAYLSKTKCGLTTYQQIYAKHHTQLLKERRSTDHPDPVATTWLISFEKVEQQNPAAADLLRFCAFLAPDAIPEEILSKGATELGERLSPVAADPFLFNKAVESLQAYSLIGRDAQTRTLSIHRLVQAVIRDSMPVGVRQQWMQRAINTVTAAFPESPDFANWPLLERLLSHALVCATWIAQAEIVTPEAARVLNQAGYYLNDRARYAEAEPLFERAIAILEQQLGANHLDMAQSLNNLAALYRVQGKFAEAEPLYQRAMAILEQRLGVGHPDTAQSLNNLAALYDAQGKYEQAEPLHLRALAIRVQRLGAGHPDTAQSLNNLAALYNAQGKYEQAELLHLCALAIRMQQLGANHPDTAQSLNNLAALYDAQGKYEQAEPLFERALTVREQQLGADHPNTASSLNNLAALYDDQGRYEQAEPLYVRALSILEQQLGVDHPNTASILNNLAALYYKQGKYEQAEPLFKRALAIDEQAYGPDHPDVAADLNNLAQFYKTQGKFAEAEPLLERALTVHEQQLGADHSNTVSSLNNLAALYQAQGKLAEAKPLYQRALAIFERTLGPEHPTTQRVRDNYAALLKAMSDHRDSTK